MQRRETQGADSFLAETSNCILAAGAMQVIDAGRSEGRESLRSLRSFSFRRDVQRDRIALRDHGARGVQIIQFHHDGTGPFIHRYRAWRCGAHCGHHFSARRRNGHLCLRALVTPVSVKGMFYCRVIWRSTPPSRTAGQRCSIPMPAKKPYHLPILMEPSLRFVGASFVASDAGVVVDAARVECGISPDSSVSLIAPCLARAPRVVNIVIGKSVADLHVLLTPDRHAIGVCGGVTTARRPPVKLYGGGNHDRFAELEAAPVIGCQRGHIEACAF